METLFIYIAKVNIALALFYLLYRLLLRKDTFIRLRRYYFLSAIIFSLSYPILTVASLGNLIDFSPTVSEAKTVTESTVMIGEFSMGELSMQDVEQTATPIDWAIVARNILLTGILFFGVRFIWQLLSIIRIKIKSEKRTLFEHSIYHLADEMTPFSFFNWIFIQTEKHSEEELKQILLHEQTHVNQWHSLDVMLVEVLRIFFWYNPIVWLMKRDITTNLEYLADNAVLQEGINTREYQYHLLQLTYHDTAVQIVNNFNVPQLKQRIMMMNRNKSPLRKVARYLIVLPLTLLLITANSVYAQENERLQDPVKKESKDDGAYKEKSRYHEVTENLDKLAAALKSEVKYPQDAKENGVHGDVVASFIIEEDGSIINSKIELGLSPSLNQEAIRVINAMPKLEEFTYTIDNEILRVKYNAQFAFRLEGEKTSFDVAMRGYTVLTIADKTGDDKPLFIVDGMKMDKEFIMSNIDRSDIEHTTIYQKEAAIANYGDEGKNGAVLITTKPSHKAKTEPNKAKNTDEVFMVVENQPEFPGGVEAMMRFLGDNIRYPVEAMKSGSEGRVILSFIINKDGSVSDIEVVRGVDPLLDAEAIRVVGLMPTWKPGTQKGEAVNVSFTMPVVFRLTKEVDEEAKNKFIASQREEAMKKLKEKSGVTVYDERIDAPDKGFLKFIAQTIKYPVIAQENGIMGVARVEYDVNEKGEISNIQITESVDPSLSAELVRVTKLIPKDIALIRSNGKAASKVEISALFRLQDESSSTSTTTPEEVDIVVVGYGKPTDNN